jgi:sec-independent protein translocase protein TatB
MFGLGMGEIVIILVLALVLLGPQKLPDAAKQLGKGLREFRKATEDLKQQFETELYNGQSKPAKPTLVEPRNSPAEGQPPPAVPPGGVPAVAGEVPLASAENIPGLEAALAEPPASPPAATAAPPAPAPAPPAEAAPKAS